MVQLHQVLELVLEGSGNSSDTPDTGNSEENNNGSNSSTSKVKDTTNKLPEDPGLYEITYIATDSWGSTIK